MGSQPYESIQFVCGGGHPQLSFKIDGQDETQKLPGQRMYTTDYIPFLISIPKFNKTCKLAIKFSQTRMGNGMTAEWHVNDEFTIVNKGWFDIKFDVKLRELHLSGMPGNLKVTPTGAIKTRLDLDDSPDLPYIDSIHALPLLPLYTVDDNIRRCEFDSRGMVLWSKTDTSTRPPVAISSGAAPMSLKVRNPRPGLTSESFVLRGTFRANGGSDYSSWESRSFTVSVRPDLAEQPIEPTIERPHQYLPTGFDGHIEWVVSLGQDENLSWPLQTFITLIELYTLPATVPKYISDGLPAQLLRILLKTRFEGIEDNYRGWTKYCMKFLRSQNFRYETLSGKNSYSGFPTHGKQGPVTNVCYLEHWLSHYEMLRAEANPECQRRVNCYDLAALGQVLLAIGLDNGKHKLEMKYLAPYGMINETTLIGINGKCNNPYFEDGKTDGMTDPKPLWTEKSGKYRSGFGNHAFLSISSVDGEKAVDATCGPEVGTKSLPEYVETAIDHVASQSLVWKETIKGEHTKGKQISPDGHVDDIEDGPGITSIISPVDIDHSDASGQSKTGLIAAMRAAKDSEQSAFPSGDLFGPSIHTDGMTLTLSWIFQPTVGSSYATIDIVVYESSGGLENLEFFSRKAKFHETSKDYISYDYKKESEGTLPKGLTGPKSLDRGIFKFYPGAVGPYACWQQTSIRLDSGKKDEDGNTIWIGAETYGMVVTVSGFTTESMPGVVQCLFNLIDNDMKASPERHKLSVTCHSGDGKEVPVKKGENFIVETECTVEGTGHDEVEIIGANVDVQRGNVVYLAPDFSAGNKSLKFKFHAKQAGSDRIAITYFTTHMHVATVKRRFIIS